MTIWLENPPRRKRRTKRRGKRRGRFVKGSAAAKRYMASIRPKAKGGSVARRKRKAHRRRSTSRRRINRPRVHRRRHRARAVSHRSNPIRHIRRHRRHRRNPGFGSVRGILGRTIEGAKNGGFVLGGEITTGFITGFIPVASTGVVGVAVRVGAAVLTGILWGFVSPKAAMLATAGGFASIGRALVKDFNVPLVGPALATADLPLGLAPMAAIPAAGAAGYVGAEGYVGADGYESSVPSMAGVM